MGREPQRVRAPGAEEIDGIPDPCPLCSGAARLDHIDLRVGTKHQTCLACGHRWHLRVTAGTDRGAAHPFRAGRSTRTGLAARLPPSHRA